MLRYPTARDHYWNKLELGRAASHSFVKSQLEVLVEVLDVTDFSY